MEYTCDRCHRTFKVLDHMTHFMPYAVTMDIDAFGTWLGSWDGVRSSMTTLSDELRRRNNTVQVLIQRFQHNYFDNYVELLQLELFQFRVKIRTNV